MKYPSIIVCVLFASALKAQTMPLKVISAAGATAQGGNYMLCYTIGETMVNSATSGNYRLQAGFWQKGLTCDVATSTIENACCDSEVVLSPNPFSETLTIAFSKAPTTNLLCSMYDLLGRLVYSAHIETGLSDFRMDCAKLPQNSYLLRLSDEASQKVVKSQIVVKI